MKILNAANTNAVGTSTVTVSTEKFGGNAGDIMIGVQTTNSDGTTAYAGGQYIALGPNASLLATADTANKHKTGKITLATSDLAKRLVSWPIDFTEKNAAIDLVAATIRGGAARPNAPAKRPTLSSDTPPSAAAFAHSPIAL